MSIPPAGEILILADNEAAARRWAAALADSTSRIWWAAEDVPDLDRLELIVTDQDCPLLRPTGGPGQWQLGQTTGRGATPAVIRVGGEGAADLRLSHEATARELALACRLLAEVVRLRRRLRTRIESQRRLTEEVMTDPLTRLANRRAWDRALEEQTAAAGGPGARLCLAILDLDHFKRINDAHGHAAGDEVLRAAAKAIAGGLRESDFVARLGGDEFGLLLPVRDEAMARSVVDRVRQGVPSHLSQRGTHRVTASAGFALTPSGAIQSPLPSPDALFRAADTALAEAKRQGRDRTVGQTEQA
jgi:diguanylate cyclase (GGDEF)-like protein